MTHTDTPPASDAVDLTGHIPSLDGLRGLAILLVLAYHMCIISQDNLVDRLFHRTAGFGWCGVDLFFVLSGFLITGILVEAKGNPHFLRNFYARRILRIWPLYLGVVFFSLVLLPQIDHPKMANFGRIGGDELWYWFHLSNFSIARAGAWRHGILDISWSLAIEEQFYLAWPFLVLLLSRGGLRRACVVLIVGALIFRAALVLWGVHPISLSVLTPSRVDALAVGAWIALYAREHQHGIAGLRPAARIVAPLMGLVILGVWASPEGYKPYAPLTQTVGFTALAVMFGALLVLVVNAIPQGACGRIFRGRFLCAFGKYSYAMYLFHLPLRALIRDTFYGQQQLLTFAGSAIPGQLLFYMLATGLTFAVAWCSWHLFEKHFLKLKKRFPSSPKAA